MTSSEKTQSSIIDNLERNRALAIIAKAERDKENVIEMLVSHMVGRTLIEELTGETVDLERRQPKVTRLDMIREWVDKNIGLTYTTAEIAEGLEVSLGSATKYVKEYNDFFVKVSRGRYTIRNGEQERADARRNKD
jgi:hypothetical protein